MSEHALAWYPVPDVDDGFGSIWFARETGRQGGSRRVSITMRGQTESVAEIHWSYRIAL